MRYDAWTGAMTVVIALTATAACAAEMPLERSGRQTVQAICVRCHGTGELGAPKIGDRAAWIPRLRNGFDYAVSSAIHGHGWMPARGGMPELTDREVRSAIAYMWNPDPAPAR